MPSRVKIASSAVIRARKGIEVLPAFGIQPPPFIADTSSNRSEEGTPDRPVLDRPTITLSVQAHGNATSQRGRVGAAGYSLSLGDSCRLGKELSHKRLGEGQPQIGGGTPI